MPDRMRRLSDTMVRAGMERALERQELERGLAGVNPQAAGYQSAMAALSRKSGRVGAALVRLAAAAADR